MRLHIVLLLHQQTTLNVSKLTRQVQAEQSLVSRSLTTMFNRGMLTVKRRGQERYYSLADSVYADLIQRLLAIPLLELA